MTATATTFQQQLDNIYLWKEVCDLHWERLLGDFYGDKEFWDDLFHSMRSEDWHDLITVAKAIQIAHPQEIRQFPNFAYNIELIEKRLHKLDPVIKPYNRQKYNNGPVSLFLAVRDVLNEINGTPTKKWTEKQRQQILEDRAYNHFENLFEMKNDRP